VVLAGILAFVLLKAHNEQKQNSLIYSMKEQSSFEYFYLGGSRKISDVTREDGVEYGIGGGMGNRFGEKDVPLWGGTSDSDLPLQLVPYYLLRVYDSQTRTDPNYADLTINYVQNNDDPDISHYVGLVGFSYDQDAYVITSNGQIYEVAGQSFFVDLFSFLEDEGVLPPKVA
jgi:hypothetical protein